MNLLTFVFAIVVLAASALASLAVWSSRGPRPKAAALAISAVLMVSVFIGLIELMGVPKPARLDITDSATRDAKVLATSVREGEVVYVWLQPNDSSAPRAYAMPWEDQKVRQLFRAIEAAKDSGTEVRVRSGLSLRAGHEDAPFYVVPQSPLPPKTLEGSSLAPPRLLDGRRLAARSSAVR